VQADLGADQVIAAIGAAPVGLALFTVPSLTGTEPDRHASHELWLVRSGSGVVTCAGDRFAIDPGQLIAISGGEEHRLIAGDQNVEVLSLWWSQK
jgi:mannose-6-phosphate isomerase-like protein (cupin superfamily)